MQAGVHYVRFDITTLSSFTFTKETYIHIAVELSWSPRSEKLKGFFLSSGLPMWTFHGPSLPISSTLIWLETLNFLLDIQDVIQIDFSTTLIPNVYLLVKLAYNHKKYIKKGLIYVYIMTKFLFFLIVLVFWFTYYAYKFN